MLLPNGLVFLYTFWPTSIFCIFGAKCLYADDLSGMTNSNYTELNELYNKYKDKGKLVSTKKCLKALVSFTWLAWCLFLLQGLEILAFPCNQFGEEEPGTTDQITEFVCTKFKSEFPIFNKVYTSQTNWLQVSMSWCWSSPVVCLDWSEWRECFSSL